MTDLDHVAKTAADAPLNYRLYAAVHSLTAGVNDRYRALYDLIDRLKAGRPEDVARVMRSEYGKNKHGLAGLWADVTDLLEALHGLTLSGADSMSRTHLGTWRVQMRRLLRENPEA